jgi:hypothetical protein
MCKGLDDILGFQVVILAENLVLGASCGDEADHSANRDTHAPDARLSAHVGQVTHATVQIREGLVLWNNTCQRLGSQLTMSVIGGVTSSTNVLTSMR